MKVQLDNVSIGYRTRQGTRQVATALTAAIRQGELTCLLGRNGVGKSTLLRTLAGFLPPLAGTITIKGRPLASYTQRELACQLGVVLTERPTVWQMTVHELVATGRSPYTNFWGRLSSEDRLIVDQALEQVGISHLAGRQVSTLSDGERQKAMIAKALAQQTDIIYLDEPTAFLDYPSKVDTLLLLKRIATEHQKTIFLSTHDVELALQIADRLWLMHPNAQTPKQPDSQTSTQPNGQTSTLAIGTPRQLADDGTLSHFVSQDGNAILDPATLNVTVRK
jgi:iron complex transport system ATP-binding protein